MSAVVGSLRVNLGLNSAEFQKNMGKANKSMNRFAKRAGVAMGAAVAAMAVGLGAMAKQSLSLIDEQAKLAQSLQTTTESIQIMARAGELGGVGFKEIEAAATQLTIRLGQAARGAGPAGRALQRMGLDAEDLAALPLDERIASINAAIEEFIPAAQKGAVAGELFGTRNGLAIARLDSDVISQAASDVERFGVAVSEVDAKQIERTNDAISQIGLITRGLGNQLAIAIAPVLEKIANGLGAISEVGGPVNQAFHALLDNLGRVVAYAAAAGAIFATSVVVGLAASTAAAFSLAGAFVVLKFAIVRTGIGALVVLIGEGVYRFAQLAKATGGFSNALGMLKDVAGEVWGRIGELTNSYGKRFEAMTGRIQGWWLDALAYMGNKWGEFVGKIAPTFNKISDAMGFDASLDTIGILNWASAMEHAAITSRTMAEEARSAAVILEESASRPLASVEAIRAAFDKTSDEIVEDWGVTIPETVSDGSDAAAGSASDAANAMQDSMTSAVSSISQAFGDWVVNGFKDFKSFSKSVLDSFKSMIAQMVATAAQNKIMIALGFGGTGVGSVASAATGGSGMLGGLGSTFLGGFGTAGAAGTGLLGGLGGVFGGVTSGFASGGLGGALGGFVGSTASGISGGIAAGGIAGIGSAIGAALPVIGIGLALFSLFKKKPAISAKDFAAIQQGLSLTGMELLSTGKAGKKTAAALKKAAGGMEEFQKQTEFYFDNFFTDTEKRAKALESLTGVFGELDIAMPTTAQGFRDIMESLDLTSKAGQTAYSELLKVAPVFTSVFGSIADAGAALSSQFGEDVFSTKEQMNRTMAALNRGAQVSVLPSGSGIINPGDVITVTERMDQLQSDTAAATMASAGTLSQIRDQFRKWDYDGMPEVREA